MEKKRTITIYSDPSEPGQELVRQNAQKTPEELWAAYVLLRKRHIDIMGQSPKPERQITIARPSWM